MPKTKLNSDEREAIVDLISEGETFQNVAEAFGISARYVRMLVQKSGFMAPGLQRTRETYETMLERCHGPADKRPDYFLLMGIVVCPEWRESLENFLKDMGERPEGYQIHRKDQDGDYTKNNCEWIKRPDYIHSYLKW